MNYELGTILLLCLVRVLHGSYCTRTDDIIVVIVVYYYNRCIINIIMIILLYYQEIRRVFVQFQVFVRRLKTHIAFIYTFFFFCPWKQITDCMLYLRLARVPWWLEKKHVKNTPAPDGCPGKICDDRFVKGRVSGHTAGGEVGHVVRQQITCSDMEIYTTGEMTAQ